MSLYQSMWCPIITHTVSAESTFCNGVYLPHCVHYLLCFAGCRIMIKCAWCHPLLCIRSYHLYACAVVKWMCCLQAVLVHWVDCLPVRSESTLHLRGAVPHRDRPSHVTIDVVGRIKEGWHWDRWCCLSHSRTKAGGSGGSTTFRTWLMLTAGTRPKSWSGWRCVLLGRHRRPSNAFQRPLEKTTTKPRRR